MIQSRPSDERLSSGEGVAILGAGPTGLGAAWRLAELGLRGFRVFEQSDHVGGLAASFVDPAGFTWDVGGHVHFSHFEYFDRLMDALLEGEWLEHERASAIWIRGQLVPYPLQLNILHLPDPERQRCADGLLAALRNPAAREPESFEEWARASFGDGIADVFLLPFNEKVWGFPPSQLGWSWVGERIARISPEDLDQVLQRGHSTWGPNAIFRYPQRGGTGEIWRRLAARLPLGSLQLRREVTRVDLARRTLHFADGTSEPYAVLISTMPLDRLAAMTGANGTAEVASGLLHSTVHVVGIGLDGSPPPWIARKSWVYFPEQVPTFHRATIFSSYSPQNVPSPGKQWSLMVEISETPARPVERAQVVDHAISGAVTAGLIGSPNDIVSVWHHVAEHGYPTPTRDRDDRLSVLQPLLERHGVYSRGRFGGWKYEVSNQDHSLMQGVEAIDRLFCSRPETTWPFPTLANRPRHR